jgi:outer membrane protein OmpA-like peptidoglycan-associated protein
MEPGSNIVLNNLFFDPGKALLRPESTAELERLTRLLADNPRLRIHLCGHTDNSQPADASQELSQRRAQAVMAYLVAHKIKPDRLMATGFGATIPVASNTTEAGRRLNQRVAFKVLGK